MATALPRAYVSRHAPEHPAATTLRGASMANRTSEHCSDTLRSESAPMQASGLMPPDFTHASWHLW
eukprot:14060336-Alexandrium_andersonii.AAC.1